MSAGLLIDPLTDMKKLISESTAFQAWLNAAVNQTVANAADALEFIHLFKFDITTEDDGDNHTGRQTRFAVVGMVGISLARNCTGSGLAAFNWATGSKFGFIEEVDDYNETVATAYLTTIHDIIIDILNLQTQPGNKEIDTFEQIDGPEAPFELEMGSRKGYQTYFIEGQQT